MSDFQNEEGEFLMTAAELRTEWELDQQAAAEQYFEEWYDYDEDSDDEPEGEDCGQCSGRGWVRYGAGENLSTSPCSACHSTGKVLDDEVDEDAGMEFGLWGSEA